MYTNPKSTKQEIKLWAFYIVDIGIVAAMIMIATYVKKVLPLGPKMTIFYYILSAVFGVFLCAKTPSHPTERNYNILFYLVKMDRNKYHAIEIKDFGLDERMEKR